MGHRSGRACLSPNLGRSAKSASSLRVRPVPGLASQSPPCIVAGPDALSAGGTRGRLAFGRLMTRLSACPYPLLSIVNAAFSLARLQHTDSRAVIIPGRILRPCSYYLRPQDRAPQWDPLVQARSETGRGRGSPLMIVNFYSAFNETCGYDTRRVTLIEHLLYASRLCALFN